MTEIIFLILTIVGKLLAVAKDIVLAGLFGVSVQTDAYFIANQIPSVLWLAFYTTIGSVFMPMYVRRLAAGTEASELAGEAVRFYSYVALTLTAFCFVFAHQLVGLVAPHAAPETKSLASYLCRIMATGFIFTGYVGIQSVVQQAHRRFMPPLIVPVINNLLATIAVVAAWRVNNVAVAAAGAVAAYLVQAIIQRWQTWRLYTSTRGWRIRRTTWQRLLLLSIPMILAVALDQLNAFVGVAFASQFGNGAISHLNYANRLSIFIAGLFSWLVSYLFFPTIAGHAASENDVSNANVITRALAIILLTTTPAAAAALALREQIITFIYGRGAFTDADVKITATMFGFFGLGIIFTCVRDPLNSIFFSYQRTKAPLVIGIGATISNVVSTYLLIPLLGLTAIPIGASLGALCLCFLQVSAIAIWKRQLLTRRLGVYFILSASAGIVAYCVTHETIASLTGMPLLAGLIINGAITVSVYVGALAFLLRAIGLSPRVVIDELRGVANAKLVLSECP